MFSSKNIKKWENADLTFDIQECGSGGDCLFYVLSAALCNIVNTTFSMQDIRRILAESLTLENVDAFINIVAEDHDQKLFQGSIHINSFRQIPNPKVRLKRLKALVQTQGWTFIGTDSILKWLITCKCTENNIFQKLKLGFFVFSSYGPGFSSVIASPQTCIYMLLFNNAHGHWQLVFLKDNENRRYSSINKEILNNLLVVS
jgi:hypothetical protein